MRKTFSCSFAFLACLAALAVGDGPDAVCHLRALYRSEKGRWGAFRDRDFSPT